MKAYIIMEDNGESCEDHKVNPVSVFLDKQLAQDAVARFNLSRETGPTVLSEEEWMKLPTDEYCFTYKDYVEEVKNDWDWYEKYKRQHLEEFEITK